MDLEERMSLPNETYEMELFSDSPVTLALFEDVQNVLMLKKKLTEKEIEAAILTPKMIISPLQILVAVNKALHAHASGHSKTRTVYSEIIFSLSPSTNITESFKRFAMGTEDKAIVVVVLGDDPEKSKLGSIADQIDGRCIPLNQLSRYTDEAEVRKMYKIAEAELSIGSLEDAVICKMATKDVS